MREICIKSVTSKEIGGYKLHKYIVISWVVSDPCESASFELGLNNSHSRSSCLQEFGELYRFKS